MKGSKSDPRAGKARPVSECARCGSAFECGTAAGLERCWCAGLPAVRAVDPGAACFCPQCLREILAAENYKT